jgi:hypothetical protein
MGLEIACATPFSEMMATYPALTNRSATTIQSVDFRQPSLAFVSNDSAFLRFGQILAPTCVGCTASILDTGLVAFPLAVEYRGMPFQKLVRVYYVAANLNQQMFYLVAKRNQVVRYFFQRTYQTGGSYQIQLRSRDSVTIPMTASQIIYGIDDFIADSSGAMSFRIFGKAGLRALVSVSSNRTVTAQSANLADSLDLSASGPGLYGTLRGHVVDSTLGWLPIKLGNQRISLINSKGAVGDSGFFALPALGTWRAYRQGTDNLRDFGLTFWGTNTEGARGTYAGFWNNHYQPLSSRFIKDDSTQWADLASKPPQAISRDSIVRFTPASQPDSAMFSLFDGDNNYSHPQFSIWGNGRIRILDSLWKRFRKGCGGSLGTGPNSAGDSLSCFSMDSVARIKVKWNADSLRIRTNLLRGNWVLHWDNTLNGPVPGFFSSTYTVDTSVRWSYQDTLRVVFPNAMWSIANVRPSGIFSSAARNTGISARIVEREILWVADEDATVRWNLRNLQGKSSLRGESAGRAGAIRTDALPRGVYLLTLENSSGPSVSWHGKIILE